MPEPGNEEFTSQPPASAPELSPAAGVETQGFQKISEEAARVLLENPTYKKVLESTLADGQSVADAQESHYSTAWEWLLANASIEELEPVRRLLKQADDTSPEYHRITERIRVLFLESVYAEGEEAPDLEGGEVETQEGTPASAAREVGEAVAEQAAHQAEQAAAQELQALEDITVPADAPAGVQEKVAAKQEEVRNLFQVLRDKINDLFRNKFEKMSEEERNAHLDKSGVFDLDTEVRHLKEKFLDEEMSAKEAKTSFDKNIANIRKDLHTLFKLLEIDGETKKDLLTEYDDLLHTTDNLAITEVVGDTLRGLRAICTYNGPAYDHMKYILKKEYGVNNFVDLTALGPTILRKLLVFAPEVAVKVEEQVAVPRIPHEDGELEVALDDHTDDSTTVRGLGVVAPPEEVPPPEPESGASGEEVADEVEPVNQQEIAGTRQQLVTYFTEQVRAHMQELHVPADVVTDEELASIAEDTLTEAQATDQPLYIDQGDDAGTIMATAYEQLDEHAREVVVGFAGNRPEEGVTFPGTREGLEAVSRQVADESEASVIESVDRTQAAEGDEDQVVMSRVQERLAELQAQGERVTREQVAEMIREERTRLQEEQEHAAEVMEVIAPVPEEQEIMEARRELFAYFVARVRAGMDQEGLPADLIPDESIISICEHIIDEAQETEQPLYAEAGADIGTINQETRDQVLNERADDLVAMLAEKREIIEAREQLHQYFTTQVRAGLEAKDIPQELITDQDIVNYCDHLIAEAQEGDAPFFIEAGNDAGTIFAIAYQVLDNRAATMVALLAEQDRAAREQAVVHGKEGAENAADAAETEKRAEVNEREEMTLEQFRDHMVGIWQDTAAEVLAELRPGVEVRVFLDEVDAASTQALNKALNAIPEIQALQEDYEAIVQLTDDLAVYEALVAQACRDFMVKIVGSDISETAPVVAGEDGDQDDFPGREENNFVPEEQTEAEGQPTTPEQPETGAEELDEFQRAYNDAIQILREAAPGILGRGAAERREQLRELIDGIPEGEYIQVDEIISALENLGNALQNVANRYRRNNEEGMATLAEQYAEDVPGIIEILRSYIEAQAEIPELEPQTPDTDSEDGAETPPETPAPVAEESDEVRSHEMIEYERGIEAAQDLAALNHAIAQLEIIHDGSQELRTDIVTTAINNCVTFQGALPLAVLEEITPAYGIQAVFQRICARNNIPYLTAAQYRERQQYQYAAPGTPATPPGERGGDVTQTVNVEAPRAPGAPPEADEVPTLEEGEEVTASDEKAAEAAYREIKLDPEHMVLTALQEIMQQDPAALQELQAELSEPSQVGEQSEFLTTVLAKALHAYFDRLGLTPAQRELAQDAMDTKVAELEIQIRQKLQMIVDKKALENQGWWEEKLGKLKSKIPPGLGKAFAVNWGTMMAISVGGAAMGMSIVGAGLLAGGVKAGLVIGRKIRSQRDPDAAKRKHLEKIQKQQDEVLEKHRGEAAGSTEFMEGSGHTFCMSAQELADMIANSVRVESNQFIADNEIFDARGEMQEDVKTTLHAVIVDHVHNHPQSRTLSPREKKTKINQLYSLQMRALAMRSTSILKPVARGTGGFAEKVKTLQSIMGGDVMQYQKSGITELMSKETGMYVLGSAIVGAGMRYAYMTPGIGKWISAGSMGMAGFLGAYESLQVDEMGKYMLKFREQVDEEYAAARELFAEVGDLRTRPGYIQAENKIRDLEALLTATVPSPQGEVSLIEDEQLRSEMQAFVIRANEQLVGYQDRRDEFFNADYFNSDLSAAEQDQLKTFDEVKAKIDARLAEKQQALAQKFATGLKKEQDSLRTKVTRVGALMLGTAAGFGLGYMGYETYQWVRGDAAQPEQGNAGAAVAPFEAQPITPEDLGHNEDAALDFFDLNTGIDYSQKPAYTPSRDQLELERSGGSGVQQQSYELPQASEGGSYGMYLIHGEETRRIDVSNGVLERDDYIALIGEEEGNPDSPEVQAEKVQILRDIAQRVSFADEQEFVLRQFRDTDAHAALLENPELVKDMLVTIFVADESGRASRGSELAKIIPDQGARTRLYAACEAAIETKVASDIALTASQEAPSFDINRFGSSMDTAEYELLFEEAVYGNPDARDGLRTLAYTIDYSAEAQAVVSKFPGLTGNTELVGRIMSAGLSHDMKATAQTRSLLTQLFTQEQVRAILLECDKQLEAKLASGVVLTGLSAEAAPSSVVGDPDLVGVVDIDAIERNADANTRLNSSGKIDPDLIGVVDLDGTEARAGVAASSLPYQGGKHVWGEVDLQLQRRAGFSKLFNAMDKAEKTYAIDYYKDRVVAHPERYGLPKGIDADVLTAAQLRSVDWDAVFADANIAEWHPELSAVAKANIRENNALLREYVKKTGLSIDTQTVDQVLEGIKKAGSVDDYITPGIGQAQPGVGSPELASTTTLSDFQKTIDSYRSSAELLGALDDWQLSDAVLYDQKVPQILTDKFHALGYPGGFEVSALMIRQDGAPSGIYGEFEGIRISFDADTETSLRDFTLLHQSAEALQALVAENEQLGLTQMSALTVHTHDRAISGLAFELPGDKNYLSIVCQTDPLRIAGVGDLEAPVPPYLVEQAETLVGRDVTAQGTQVALKKYAQELSVQGTHYDNIQRMEQEFLADVNNRDKAIDQINKMLNEHPETRYYVHDEDVARALMIEHPDKAEVLARLSADEQPGGISKGMGAETSGEGAGTAATGSETVEAPAELTATEESVLSEIPEVQENITKKLQALANGNITEQDQNISLSGTKYLTVVDWGKEKVQKIAASLLEKLSQDNPVLTEDERHLYEDVEAPFDAQYGRELLDARIDEILHEFLDTLPTQKQLDLLNAAQQSSYTLDEIQPLVRAYLEKLDDPNPQFTDDDRNMRYLAKLQALNE